MANYYRRLSSLFVLAMSFINQSAFAEDNLFSSYGTETLPTFSDAFSFTNRTIQRDIPVQVDTHFSPFVGSDLFISALRGYQFLDDKFISGNQQDNSNKARWIRAAKVLLLENTLFSWGMVAQHELFGHGFRSREFHLHDVHYQINPWSGKTLVRTDEFAALSWHEKAAIDTGGLEATAILAKQLRDRWLHSGILDNREGHLYFINAFDQTFYVLNTKFHKDKIMNGNDIHEYLYNVNQWHQRPVLNSHQLRKKILLDFLDPYLFYSLYSIGSYLIEGTQTFEYPMIPIGNYRYLPSMRMLLAPYGPEYQFNNFIHHEKTTLQIGLRYGSTGNNHSSGITVEGTNLFTSEMLFIDSKLDLWRQPKLFSLTSTGGGRCGGALSFTIRYRVASQLEVKGQAGYKTTGYIPGEPLKHNPILRVGLVAFL